MNQLYDMSPDDLSEILSLERNAQPSPWARLSFEESLNRSHHCRILKSAVGIVGYHIICPVADELHILNLVVARQYQGNGYAHELMQDIFDTAQHLAVGKILLEVRASNKVAQSLYRTWGFEQLSIRKNYYQPVEKQAQREDAIIMLRLLEQHK